MALHKLPFRFTDEMLAEPFSVRVLLSRINVVWAGADGGESVIYSLPQGESMPLSCSRHLYDFQRTKVVVIISGTVRCEETSIVYRRGECVMLSHWFAATICADDDAQLLIVQTCASKQQLSNAQLQIPKHFRSECKPKPRLPSAGDVLELLTAFQSGLGGTSQMVFAGLCDRFVSRWRGLVTEALVDRDRVEKIAALIERFTEQSRQALFGHELLDGQPAHRALEIWLAHAFKLDELTPREDHSTLERDANGSSNLSARMAANVALFDTPVFIVAAPRSGSTMLFEALKENKELWTIGDESHQVFESIKELHPAAHGFESNRLTAEHVDNKVGMAVVGGLTRRLRNSRDELMAEMGVDQQPSTLRFLEKTPKNALRIPFLKALFPNAKFIFLHRRPEPNIASIINAWKSGNFVTYPRLPNWEGLPWSLLLCPEWRRLAGRPLVDIAAWQWHSTNKQIMNDLNELPEDDWCSVSYEQLVNDKATSLKALCEFATVPFGPKMQALADAALPASKYTVTLPDAEKWRVYEEQINVAMTNIEGLSDLADRLATLSNESTCDTL